MNLSNPLSRPKLKLRSVSTNKDAPGAPALTGERALSSATLLQGQDTVSIHHNGERYQLRSTRSGGLILTK
jgi:hemin uptake protein HemP